MSRSLRTTLLLFLLPLFAAGQSFEQPEAVERIYTITARLAEQLAKAELGGKDLPDLGGALPAGTDADLLPNGHYLSVKVVGEDVSYDYFQRHGYQAQVSGVDGKLHIRLYDAAGKERQDAEILADGKPVRYKESKSAYIRRDWRVGLLRISVGRDTLFYSVTEEISTSRFAHDFGRFSRTGPGYLLLTPYRFTRGSVRYVSRVVTSGDWSWYSYPFQRPIRNLINPTPIVGYVTTSQPKYRPGDTLRVSAYLTKPNGRPLTLDSLSMSIVVSRPSYKQVVYRKIARREKGRYTFTLPIPEDWPLDNRYRITFSPTGLVWRRIDPSISFELEDYALAEYELSVKQSEDTRLPDAAWIDVHTRDINGLPLPDGEIKVTVLADHFYSALDSAATITVPDTLYTHTEATDNRLDRRIILPDSIFRQGYFLNIKGSVQLTGPSGEYQEKDFTMGVDRRYQAIPELRTAGDSLHYSLAPASAPKYRMAQLISINTKKDTLIEEVKLPGARPLVHNLVKYELRFGEQTTQKLLEELSPVVGSPFTWNRDTLVINFPNSHRQPLQWELFRQGQTIATGNEESGSFQRENFAPGTELLLQYRYLAAGTWQLAELDASTPRYDQLTDHKKLLDIELDQPQKVLPGKTVRVSVDVTDQQGRPAANVRLSAGSYNARFDKSPVTTPTYVDKTKRRKNRQGYAKTEVSKKFTATPPEWMVEDLLLDSTGYYSLRYPDPEFWLSRNIDTLLPTGRSIAHITPFIVNKNRVKTIRTVYLDDRLAYWYHPNITTPYSIPTTAGRHTVSLRTDDASYERQITVAAGEQLIFSFDEERYTAAGWTRIGWKAWTPSELNDLQKRIFSLTEMRASVPIHYRANEIQPIESGKLTNGGWSPLGLATILDQITVWLPGQDSIKVKFEPGATYRVSRDRDRLYPLTLDQIAANQKKKASNGPAVPGLPSYRFVAPPERRPPAFRTYLHQLPYVNPKGAISRIQFTNLPDSIQEIVLHPTSDTLFYKATGLNMITLQPGTYDIIYHVGEKSLYRQTLYFPVDCITLIPYHQKSLDPLADFDRFIGYTLPDQVKNPEEPLLTYSDLSFSGNTYRGIVMDGNTPLIGVSIRLAGTNLGTVTDLDGRFSLALPDGPSKLLITYTGYATLELPVSSSANYSMTEAIMLEGSSNSLDEVLVVGYGTARKRDVVGSVTTVGSNDVNNSYADPPSGGPRILIRGASSIPANLQSYYLNGVKVDADVDLADIPGVTSIEVIEGEVYITTNGRSELLSGDSPDLTVATRENFADYAAFVPGLSTDRKGHAEFDIHFPDDITAWNTFAVGQDRKRRIGFTLKQTTAFLPVQAQLYLPRFLVEGDNSEAITLAVNRTGTPQNVRLEFSGEGLRANSRDTLLDQSVATQYPIAAGKETDSLSFQFALQSLEDGAVSDGEKRSLKVYPKGTEMVSGELFFLQDGVSNLPDSFIREERGPVTVRILGNRVDQLLNDLDHIIDYPYECTEQTASRLIGLLAKRRIQSAEGENAEDAATIRKMIRKLEKLRKPDGGFGWWGSSESSTPWITLHVYRALSVASKTFPVEDLEPVRRYLLTVAPSLLHFDQLQLYLTLGEEGNPPTPEEMFRLDTVPGNSHFQLLARARLHQLRGDSIDVQAILDTAGRQAISGLYWGERRHLFYRRPFQDRLSCTLLAQRILRAAGREEAADKAVNYLLGHSPSGTYAGNVPLLGTNTLESAILIDELLPVLLTDGEVLSPPVVEIDLSGNTRRLREFPFEVIIPPGEVAGAVLRKSGSGPVPAGIYQRYFERSPVLTDNGYRITSKVVDNRDRPLEFLQKGETAYLEVTVEAAADGEYVLIEAPIPAGCSYANRSERRGSFAVHREYRRDRVAIFCDRLPAGSHTYRVALEPRFGGTYTLNPGRAELQYLPVVNGVGNLKDVRILDN